MKLENFVQEIENSDFFKFNKMRAETKSYDFGNEDQELLADLYYLLKSGNRSLIDFSKSVVENYVDIKNVKEDHFATEDDIWCPFVVSENLAKEEKKNVIDLGKNFRKYVEKQEREENSLKL